MQQYLQVPNFEQEAFKRLYYFRQEAEALFSPLTSVGSDASSSSGDPRPSSSSYQQAEPVQKTPVYDDDEYVDYSEEEGEDDDEGLEEGLGKGPGEVEEEIPSNDQLEEVFCTRMVRIQNWRESHPISAETASAEELSLLKDLKRKGNLEVPADTERSATKRARSACGQVRGGYNCTACGSSFSTKFTLRRHGKGVRTSPACRAAVSYQFE